MNANVPHVHDFRERLAFSEGVALEPDVLDRIAAMVPNAERVRRASVAEDKHGTDYWIDRTHGLPSLSVDVKHRAYCPIERFGTDDACVETTSVYLGDGPPWRDDLRRKVGWSLDYSKRTDFVAFTWPHDKGTRFWIVPFVPFCRANRINWRAWAHLYSERPARNEGYLTLSVYPPRAEIATAMRALMSGVA